MRRYVVFIVLILLVVLSNNLSAQSDELSEKEKANKALLEWVFENGVNANNPDAWDSVLSPNYIRYCEAMPPDMQVIKGIETMKLFLGEHFKSFPDWHEEITDWVIQGDKIAVISNGTGTMIGDMQSFKATGKKVSVSTFAIHTFKDGKIIESKVCWDNIYFLTQAGLFPPPTPSGN